jgi:cytochrome c biogenesis protein CcdA/thioredoxin-related protein
MKYFLLSLVSVFLLVSAAAQDSAAYNWNVTSKKVDDKTYELIFSTPGNSQWQLYGPNEVISEVPAVEIQLGDSAITIHQPFNESGEGKTISNPLFDNAQFKVYEGPLSFTARLSFEEVVPANLLGTMTYTYGKGDEFFMGTPFSFSVELEGGQRSVFDLKRANIDLANPVNNCGGTGTEGEKSLWTIFLLGMLGGLLGLIMPCTFPMIPVTVSFFTKQGSNPKRGVLNAFMYSFFIFLVYVLLSVPFYFLKASNTDILNNISTNPVINIFFGLVFLAFALSFFGLFEITLPSRLTNTVGTKSSIGSMGGIFFMALTLAIVSFSCTGPILGTLLVGAFGKEGNPFQLTVAMAGFGLTLGLPFGIFAMFPKWLSKLPRSGSWMNTVKIVFGFVELALMVKFFSNADLVMHWGLLKREVFIGIWVLLGIATVLFLFGILKFKYDPPPAKLSKMRIFFGLLFLAFTLYLIPGMTNTKYANLKMISGFPPPLSYSIYPQAESSGIHLVNDYEKALELSRQLNKPVLVDFTGWACVNCRNMEENVWSEPEIKQLIDGHFILTSLYVDDRGKLPVTEQHIFTTSDSSKKEIVTIGDKYATLQTENFRAASQPWYAIIDGNERLMNLPVGYTPSVSKYAAWLNCGLDAFKKISGQASK